MSATRGSSSGNILVEQEIAVAHIDEKGKIMEQREINRKLTGEPGEQLVLIGAEPSWILNEKISRSAEKIYSTRRALLSTASPVGICNEKKKGTSPLTHRERSISLLKALLGKSLSSGSVPLARGRHGYVAAFLPEAGMVLVQELKPLSHWRFCRSRVWARSGVPGRRVRMLGLRHRV